VKDLLGPLGAVSVRRMFGGAGVFSDGLMFGLIADDTLYLKTDEADRERFAAEGMEPFVYSKAGRETTLSYWRAPDRLLDDPDELVSWCRRALAAARRSRPAGPARSRRSRGA
jgi:DNA transformation protein